LLSLFINHPSYTVFSTSFIVSGTVNDQPGRRTGLRSKELEGRAARVEDSTDADDGFPSLTMAELVGEPIFVELCVSTVADHSTIGREIETCP